MIRIKTADVASKAPMGVTFTTAAGRPVKGVTNAVIDIQPEALITATLDINVAAVDIEAHPLLSLETVRAAAEAHGFDLTPKD